MFSVHIGNHNLLTKGLNFKIYVLVNCVSVKLHTSCHGVVHIKALCVPITTETIRKSRDVCGNKHVHLCMLNLAIYIPN